MKKTFLSLIAVLLTLSAISVCAFAEGENPESSYREIVGSYADGTTGFIYSDDMLLQSSYEMSGDLAKIAVALSGAAYGDGSNAIAMLESEKMGYTASGFDYGSRTLDDNDKVAFVVGKKLRDDGKVLYIVAVRGTEGLEWFSDFNMGDPATNGGNHPGFYIAAERAMGFLNSVFSADGVAASDRYILFTGHSRGAAVANILAAHYSDSGIAPESHIFGYTFACPAVSKSAGQNGYENIFNFNNTGDAIPTMPLASWGYHRYGIDNPCGFTASPAFRMKYYNEFGGENASTSDTVAYEIAIETIFPEETTVNEPLGHFGAMLLAWSLSQTNEISLHEFLIRYGKDVFTEQYIYDQVLEKTGLKPLYQLLSGDSSKYKDQQSFLKKAKSDLASFSQEEFDAWLVNNQSTLLPGSTEEEYAQWVSENRGTLSNQFKQERFDRWKAENQSMLRDIYNTTGQLIEKYADIDPVISSILKLAPIAWDAGTVIGCVIDISDNSAGGPLQAITDGHRTGTYVVGINSRYFGYRAYENLTDLSAVTIPACVKTIGYHCFYNSGVTAVNGMDHVEYMGDRAFYNATKLTGIKLGKLILIHDFDFYNCTSLKELDLGMVERIGVRAFENCSSLEELYIPDSVRELNTTLIQTGGYFTPGDSYYIGPFEGCIKLRILSVGGVKELKNGMLRTGSSALEKLIIRGSVKSIGIQALFSRKNGYQSNSTHNLYDLDVDHPVELIIEEGVEYIGHEAFRGCTMFTSIMISSTVKEIDYMAFLECASVKDLKLGSVERIGELAFMSCSSLENLYIPDTVKTIDVNYTGPFDYCTGLKTISIGGIETLTNGMLRTGSSALEKLTIRGSVKSIEAGALYSYGTPQADHYGTQLYNLETDHPVELIIEEGVESIGSGAFRGCSMFTSVSIPSTVKTIGDYAFASCTGLVSSDSISFGNTELGNYMFANCTGLEAVDLDGVRTIGESAFSGCTSLANLDLTGVESIENKAFMNCSALEDLYIPDSVKEIKTGGGNYGPFYGCTGLKTISVGGVETLTTGMLKTGSQALEKLTIRGTVKSIGTSAFDSRSGYSYFHDMYCNGYTFTVEQPVELVIEEGVESIGSYAFYSCKMFTSISIPSTVTTIGDYAFGECTGLRTLLFTGTDMPFASTALYNCPNLTVILMNPNDAVADYCVARSIPCVRLDAKLVLPAALTSVKNEAFQNNVTTWVVFPNTIESIGRLAFADCGKLSRVDIPVASVEIDPEAFANSPRVTIFAPAGGTVQSFAEEHGIRFVAIESSVSPAA